jgi:hypothetical protein
MIEQKPAGIPPRRQSLTGIYCNAGSEGISANLDFACGKTLELSQANNLMDDHGWLGEACREKLQEIDFLRGVNDFGSVILCGTLNEANLLM